MTTLDDALGDDDLLGRRKFADGLEQLILRSKKPLSILIDGRWGEGKTFFARRWQEKLNPEYPAIYLDAFETDYASDPFQALCGAILNFVMKEETAEQTRSKQFLSGAAGKAVAIAALAPKLLTRAGVHAIFGNSDNDALEDLQEALADGAGEAVELALRKKIDYFAEQEEQVKQFKKLLSGLPADLAKGGEAKPIIFLIDELDRCRPDYALALIERIKHFFETENLHFVLFCNADQLKASVEHTYGSTTDAEIYYEKFFDFKFCLPSPETRGALQRPAAIYIQQYFSEKFSKLRKDRLATNVHEDLVFLAECLNPNIRLAGKIVDQIIVSLPKNNLYKGIGDHLAVGLSFIKWMDTDLYRKILNETFDDNALVDFFLRGESGHYEPDSSAQKKAEYILRSFRLLLGIDVSANERESRNLFLHSSGRRDLSNFARDYFEVLPSLT
ncbi:MAG: P-loop NTPase fold protein [Pseudomonadota bacterium]